MVVSYFQTTSNIISLAFNWEIKRINSPESEINLFLLNAYSRSFLSPDWRMNIHILRYGWCLICMSRLLFFLFTVLILILGISKPVINEKMKRNVGAFWGETNLIIKNTKLSSYQTNLIVICIPAKVDHHDCRVRW